MVALPHPTARTLGLAALGAGVFALAAVTGQQDLVWVALFAIAVPVVSLGLALLVRPSFSAQRDVTPPVVAAGGTARVDLEVTATRAGLGASAVARDDPGPRLGTPHTLRLDASRAGAATTGSYVVRPRRRGRYEIDGLAYRTGDGLGFWQFARRLPLATTVVATPRVTPLPSAQVPAYGEVGETPIPQTALIGPDDATVREYHSGDDVRRIHWRSTAHTGELMVRREEAAWDPTAWVLLDSRAGVHPLVRGERPTFEWLVETAASVGLRLLEDGYAVGLVDAEGRAHEVTGEAVAAGARWLDPLVDVDVTGESDLHEATTEIARRASEHVLVALLGGLDATTAELLVASSGSRHAKVVLVIEPDADARASFEHGRSLLVDHGWDVRGVTGIGTDLAAAWLGPATVGARR